MVVPTPSSVNASGALAFGICSGNNKLDAIIDNSATWLSRLIISNSVADFGRISLLEVSVQGSQIIANSIVQRILD
jgi:hypothetical protein